LVRVPVLVVQGERDPFGIPPDGPGRSVVRVPGDHSLRSTAEIKGVIAEWLGSLI
jgi:predicted alpha/beta-hydrolase family hydrolase